MRRGLLCLAAASALLAGCYQVGSLEGTQREQMRVEGRLFEVRLGRTGNPNEWRMQINRATMVIGPDLETEGDRAREVARRIIERTCQGRPYSQPIDGMRGINYYTTFVCQ